MFDVLLEFDKNIIEPFSCKSKRFILSVRNLNIGDYYLIQPQSLTSDRVTGWLFCHINNDLNINSI